MQTFLRTSLPKSIKVNGKKYVFDQERSYNFKETKLSFANSVVVKVLARKLRGREDLHGKPYQPSEWIFTKSEDIFGNKEPVQIETGEWWFNGHFIQKQDHPSLLPFVTFEDSDNSHINTTHVTMEEAIIHCLSNPVKNPLHSPKDFL